MKINEFIKELKEKKGNMYDIPITELDYGLLGDACSNKTKFNYGGVYAIYDENDDVIYVGESYKETVNHRLYLHCRANSSNSTFGKKFSLALFGEPKENLNDAQRNQLYAELQALKFVAFPYVDWESYLIEMAKPKFNARGIAKEQS